MSDLHRRLSLLAGEDEWRRARELERLRSEGVPPDVLDALIDTLGDPDATRRAAARMALAALAAPGSACHTEAQAGLRSALGADQENVRVLAASALGEAGDMEAGGALIGALGDSALNVQAAAADGLGSLRYGLALEPLAELARADELWVRAAALVALGRLEDERAVPILDQHADERQLVKTVVEALEAINHPSALEPLRRAYEGAPDEALRAAGLILASHPRVEPPEWVRTAARDHQGELVRQLLADDEAAIARLLGLTGSADAAETLISLVGPPRRSEAALAGLLAMQPGDRAGAVLDRLDRADDRELVTLLSILPPLADHDRIRALVPFLDHDSRAVRAAAAEALARSPAQEAIPLLAAEIDRGGARPELILAIGGLGEVACTSLVPLLEDPAVSVRAAAASALSRCANEGAEADLRSALARETDPEARQAMLRGLARAAGAGAMDELVTALSSERLDMRLAAIEAMGLTRHESAVPALERPLAGEAAERLAALHALSRLPPEAAAPVVARHLDAADLEARRAAARSAIAVAEALDAGAVERMMGDADARVRGCAARVLGRRGETGRPGLERMAAGDPDPEVRGIARRALSRAG